MAVTYLATHTSAPTLQDYSRALRILKYLAGSPTVGIKYTRNRPMTSELHVDASHMLHASGHGHGGITILVGGCLVFCCSFKLKSITRSSAESEIVTLDEGVTYALWTRSLLCALGYPQQSPTVIHQDNKSTIIIATKGGGSFKRTKHMVGKHSFIQENLLNNKITLKYCPSNQMLADILTKPLTRPQLQYSLNAMKLV